MSTESTGTPPVDQLIALNRSATIARLLAGAAHEVNNALQVIGGTTELLRDSPGLTEPIAHGLQRIQAQSARAASALAEVMAFARERAGATGEADLREVAARAIALRSYSIARARISIALHTPPEGRFGVDGSASLLQQALLNLIVNAEQALAGRDGGIITVDVERQDRWCQVRISDNGPGVDPAVRETMFEPFVTTKSRDAAPGLGLTVARAIAEMHRGTLTHEAQLQGACFALRLPAAP